MIRTILTTALLVVLSASLTANYFLYEKSNMKTLSVEPIEYARIK